MAVFKRKYTAKSGKAKSTQKWSVDFRDHDGVARRVVAFTDKSASLELERQLKKLVALRMAGSGPDAELSRFLESCPGDIRDKLAVWGVIAGERAAAGRALGAHISDWREAMAGKGLTKKQITESAGKIDRLAGACGWRFISDISASGVDRWRNEQRTAGRALMTLNHYLTVAKTFCNWLVKEKRLSENPLAHLSKLNAATDRRLERHPYSVEELGLLLAAAEKGGTHHRMTGMDRALLYRTAVDTGFRWSELHSLTRASFDFESTPATVTIEAAYAKNGKEDTISLRPELAADLNARMALFLPSAKAFAGMRKEKGAEMIREDLEAAGILARNRDGELITTDEYGLVYDFHGLRHTFGTLLNKARVPLATAQKLMRHSDPKLTANIYTHVMLEDKAEALAKLPTIAAVVMTEKEAATGTCDAAPESDKIVVMNIDSFGMDSMAKIKTYMDGGEGGKAPVSAVPEHIKTPVPQGQTGASNTGATYPIRTGDLRFTKPLLYH